MRARLLAWWRSLWRQSPLVAIQPMPPPSVPYIPRRRLCRIRTVHYRDRILGEIMVTKHSDCGGVFDVDSMSMKNALVIKDTAHDL